jgi:glucose/arabinose dehydrogenase
VAGGSIAGVVGRIQWSYYNAAAINGYTVTRSETGAWSLRGVVVASDAFKLTQRPLVFVAPYDQGEMRWPIRDLALTPDGTLTATLGPPDPPTVKG